MTGAGATLGTIGYMAPEQAMGSFVDARADVFAIGCVMFECLTGRPPFGGTSEVTVLSRMLRDETPRIGDSYPDAPETVDELVAALMTTDADRRPRDAGEVLDHPLRRLWSIMNDRPEATRKPASEHAGHRA